MCKHMQLAQIRVSVKLQHTVHDPFDFYSTLRVLPCHLRIAPQTWFTSQLNDRGLFLLLCRAPWTNLSLFSPSSSLSRLLSLSQAATPLDLWCVSAIHGGVCRYHQLSCCAHTLRFCTLIVLYPMKNRCHTVSYTIHTEKLNPM